MRFLLFASILLYVCDVQAIPHDWNSTTLINVIKSITRYDNHTYRLDNVATIDDEDLVSLIFKKNGHNLSRSFRTQSFG